jgi:ethanolamine utilization protein EutQ
MSVHHVRPDPADDDPTGAGGAIVVNRAVTRTPLTELGAGLITFTDDDHIEGWVTQYEEVLYVVEGHLELESAGTLVTGGPGAILAVEKGTPTTYRGTKGTKVFYALWPKSWSMV